MIQNLAAKGVIRQRITPAIVLPAHMSVVGRIIMPGQRATIDLVEELKWQTHGKFFDCMPVYRTNEEDLDHKKIEEFLEKRKDRGSKKITKDTLLSYYLITQEHTHIYATTAGILLFGKRPQHFFSEAMIICSHFKGIEGREAIASIDCVGTLFEQFETAYEFIVNRLSKSFTIKGPEKGRKT